MESKNKPILFIVAGSLLLNVVMFNRLGGLRQEIQNVNHSNMSYMRNLESGINNIQSGIHNIIEENKWVVSRVIKPNLEISKPEDIHLDLEFSLRELEKDSKVRVSYKAEVDEIWTEVTATNIGGNSFIAPLVLNNKENYQYQIVAKGNLNISSDIYSVDNNFTKPNPLVLISHGSRGANSVRYEFTQYNPIFDFYKVKTAVAKVYIDEKLDRVIDMNELNISHYDPYYREEPIDIIGFETEVNRSNTKIIIHVEYMDGTIHEGEIFPEENFMYKYY